MKNSQSLETAINYAFQYAEENRLQYVTPELFLLGIGHTSPEFLKLCQQYGVSFREQIQVPIEEALGERVPEDAEEYEIETSFQMEQLLAMAEYAAAGAGKEEVEIMHVLCEIIDLSDSLAAYLMRTCFTEDKVDMLRSILDAYTRTGGELLVEKSDTNDIHGWFELPHQGQGDSKQNKWREMVVCINDQLAEHNPLIGRQAELERTIQVLCRRDKNNPLHVGEPGVGKTALIYGLAQLIEDGNVPACLQGAKIYQMEMGTMLADTKYRGEFEKRMKSIMDGLKSERNAIVYVDEIHTLIGAGSTDGDSMDASNLLKPYMAGGEIRFIGATTYKEYNRYFLKSQGIVRRFQKIDISEPTQAEAVQILEGLCARYEQHHGVTYEEGLMKYVVEMSSRYITDRFLPDKAIDLIDEAGAYRQLHPLKGKNKKQVVDKTLINETLKRICRLTDQMLSASEDGNEELATLESDLQSKIYGQDEAIRQVVESVQMAKAGLNDADKPLASLLFVGPTGVGKTELCKVLAQQLNIDLVRFDMSEYTEKHTVAKLIGSPAGYVGYEDGGLLTDAIRKSPNCVLLLDEIEKAHQDIYNILLQVMDYARLTDNRGNKADFKNVILVMTSNAGAQHASMASVGFGNMTSRGEAMLQTVKKTFKPEFLNRLSGTVVFSDMSREMASLILEKKLNELRERLAAKKVTLRLTDAAKDLLLEKGFTTQYGAREMDRVIRNMLNPLLIRAILFGELKNGGEAHVDKMGDALQLVH